MLNILFWNLKRNAIEGYIIDCIVENNVDIAVFSEFDGVDFIKIEKSLGKMYGCILAVQDDRKVTLIAKTTFSVAIIQQQNRYNIYNVKTAVKDYLLAAIHLEDRRNYDVFCKHFLEKNAKYFWRMLHLQIGESCKASAGSYSASYIAIADHI